MLRCGLGLDGRLLALAAASHSGEHFHVAGVREILARVGLAPGALQCPPDLPLDARTAVTVALPRALGVDGEADTDRVTLDLLGRPAVLGGGRAVGEVSVTLPLSRQNRFSRQNG